MVTYTQAEMLNWQRYQVLARIYRTIETVLFFFILAWFSGAVIGIVFPHPPSDQVIPDNPLARSLWFPIYGLVLALSIRSLPQTIRSIAFTPLIILCVMWMGLSFIWSELPAVTFRRSIALMMGTILGFVIAARYDWGQLVQRIAFVFVLLAIITLLMGLLQPSKGIMQDIHAGAWRGPWVEKNYLGGNMAKGLAAAMCAYAMRPDRWWFWIPGGILCFALVILSTSKTALMAALLAIILFLAIRVFRRFPILRIPVMYFSVMGVTIFSLAILVFPEEAFGLIGKDPTLTGRTDIWVLLIESIKEKLTLGYGYGAYWQEELGPSFAVRNALEWGVPTAHNGWMEIALSGGLVIVVLFAIHYVVTMLFAINRLGRGGIESYWAIIWMFMFFFFSMSESTILAQNDLTWAIFVATSAKLWAFEQPYWRDRRRVPLYMTNRYGQEYR